ncbi:MAG: class A beta-lactamase [Muribaculaceae bacterium]|nr:class A beta-lactamase [Muribaculaceae bacterium]
MKNILVFLSGVVSIIMILVSTACSGRRYAEHERHYSEIEAQLNDYVESKADARIGVAVIVNGEDTITVNGNSSFPMLSVYKFPQALAVADYCLRNGVTISDTVTVNADELKENTWSPMRDKYGVRNIRLPLSEILEYSLSQSDNNACDILFRLIGGPVVADSLMKALGYPDIAIVSTEDDMHRDTGLCYQNSATPIAMAALFDKFYRQDMWHNSPVYESVGSIMMMCRTGNSRLPAPLMPTNARIGHKTGTGDTDAQGRIIAVNDAGYVFLPNRDGYAIAVFISDSAYGMAETEQIIADISEIVFKGCGKKQRK